MLDVKQTLNGAEEKMKKASKYLQEELARIRAGRANAAILDGVRAPLEDTSTPSSFSPRRH